MKFEIQLTDPADARRRIEMGFAHHDVKAVDGMFAGKGFVGSYYIKDSVLHVAISQKPFWATERMIKSRIEGYLK